MKTWQGYTLIALLMTIAHSCTPCEKEITNKLLKKITKSLNGDKKTNESETNETQNLKKKIPTKLQSRYKSTCQKLNEQLQYARRNTTVMPCYHPQRAWYAKTINPETGKRSLVFNKKASLQRSLPIEINCGKCMGCRSKKRKTWAIRMLHEAQMHHENIFVTLTYSDEGLKLRTKEYEKANKKRSPDNQLDIPIDQSIHVRDIQLFMKRLRKAKGKTRFFACGEYGDKNLRPHYHLILFGQDFSDAEIDTEVTQREDYIQYTSKLLTELWPYGRSNFGQVSFDSCSYVAKYVQKKINGEQAEGYYSHYNEELDEIQPISPEFATMSRRPGIGHTWFTKFKTDLYPSDNITIQGKTCTVPKYYDQLLEKTAEDQFKIIKQKRLEKFDPNHPDLTPDRLQEREKVHKLNTTAPTGKI